MKKRKLLLDLFLTMLKVGLFTFGGGYAMIAMLENEFIENKKWIDKEEFLDMSAIAESTPGPIAINAATYIGYKTAGFAGAVVSTVAMCIPSFVIIFTVSLFFDAFLELKLIANAFKGIQICVLYLILSAGWKMFKSIKKNAFNVIIFTLVVALMVVCSFFGINFSTVFYILISGLIGVVFNSISILGRKKGEDEK